MDTRKLSVIFIINVLCFIVSCVAYAEWKDIPSGLRHKLPDVIENNSIYLGMRDKLSYEYIAKKASDVTAQDLTNALSSIWIVAGVKFQNNGERRFIIFKVSKCYKQSIVDGNVTQLYRGEHFWSRKGGILPACDAGYVMSAAYNKEHSPVGYNNKYPVNEKLNTFHKYWNYGLDNYTFLTRYRQEYIYNNSVDQSSGMCVNRTYLISFDTSVAGSWIDINPELNVYEDYAIDHIYVEIFTVNNDMSLLVGREVIP